jgi:hypothetical protein
MRMNPPTLLSATATMLVLVTSSAAWIQHKHRARKKKPCMA